MAHSSRLVLSDRRGSLWIAGALHSAGSLQFVGTLGGRGSLMIQGTLPRHGSLSRLGALAADGWSCQGTRCPAATPSEGFEGQVAATGHWDYSPLGFPRP
jgi:hypothetical protein